LARLLLNRRYFTIHPASFEDRDFNAKIQTLYNELRLRNQFEKIKTYENSKFLAVAEEAWETYESIL
jgi:hypothetical protein